MPGRAAVAGALLAIPCMLLLFACGGGSFPEAEPCVAPSPTATPRATTQVNDFVYRRVTLEGFAQLETLTANLRSQWPNRTPSNRAEFRESFVRYVRDTTCIAADLRALEPRTEPYAAFDAAFDEAMDATIVAAEFGQDAVRTRNSSAYKQWLKQVDTLPLLYEQAEAKLPVVSAGR